MDAKEIIDLLGGTSAAARFFEVKPPSVSNWLLAGVIPEDRLIKKAALLESKSGYRFSRRSRWPNSYREIWPELATPTDSTPNSPPALAISAQAAMGCVAQGA